jgi:hypothetical protein
MVLACHTFSDDGLLERDTVVGPAQPSGMDCHEYDLEGATGVVICLVISCFTLKYRTDRWQKAVMCGMSQFHQSTRMEM